MKKLMSGLLAATIAATFVVSAALPLNAAPAFVPKSEQVRSDVEQVQYDPWRRWNRNERRRDRVERREGRRDWREDRREARRDWREDRREARRDFYRDGDRYYYNGHRGYRDRRDGYREYNGYWFPAAAFVAGALVTGAIAADRADRAGSGNSHVDWCYDRYRSYRAYDNTFQPNNGPRRECVSPY